MILAIDPGLDCCGVALFEPPAQHLATLQGYSPCLRWSGTWKTSPQDSIETRLGILASLFMAVPRPITTVVLEVPARVVAYRRNQGAGAGIMAGLIHLSRVIGMFEGLGYGVGLPVIRIPASTQPKDRRHERVFLLWPNLGRTQEDQRDAISTGLSYLLDRRRTSAA